MVSIPNIFIKMVGLLIKTTPIKPINDEYTYLEVTFSFKKIPAKNVTQIGDVKISEIASPKGNKITAKNQQIFPINPRIPRR